jgi:hypothetical protein
MEGLNGTLSKREALESYRKPKQTFSWRVEATTKDGKRWCNGVRLATREEAKVYIQAHVSFDLEKQGYVTAEVLRCDGEPPVNSITRRRAGGRAFLGFMHGTCTSLEWQPVT